MFHMNPFQTLRSSLGMSLEDVAFAVAQPYRPPPSLDENTVPPSLFQNRPGGHRQSWDSSLRSDSPHRNDGSLMLSGNDLNDLLGDIF